MPSFKYVVFSNPVPGKEDAYNDWYSNQHLDDVLKVDGFVAAQRFKRVEVAGNTAGASPYMAIYEIEADDPQAVLDRLVAAVGEGTMIISDALDTDAATFLYEPVIERKVTD
jgi:hypothetical protein